MSRLIRAGRGTAVSVNLLIGVVGKPLSVDVGPVGPLVIIIAATGRLRSWLFANVEESAEDWKQGLPRV